MDSTEKALDGKPSNETLQQQQQQQQQQSSRTIRGAVGAGEKKNSIKSCRLSFEELERQTRLGRGRGTFEMIR